MLPINKCAMQRCNTTKEANRGTGRPPIAITCFFGINLKGN
jgi:hypothetical protein